MNKRTRNKTLATLLASLAVLGFLRSPVQAEPFDLAEHLDPETTFYVTLHDLESSWSRFPSSPLGRLFAEEAIQNFLEKLGAGEDRQSAEEMRGPGGLPISIPEHDSMPGRVAFALTVPPDGASALPRVVGSLCLGAERDDVVALLNTLLEQLRSADPKSCAGRISVIDGEIMKISILDTDVSYFWNGDALIFGSRREDLVAVLKSIDEPRTDGLATVPRFKALKGRTEADESGMFLYTALDAFAREGKRSRTRADRLLRAFGFSDMKAIGLTSRMREDGRGVTRLRIDQPGTHRGFLDVFGRGDKPLVTAKYFAPQAVLGLTARLDAQGVSRLASRLTAAMGFDVQVKAKDGDYQTPWPIDLARAVGEEAGLYLAPARMGLMPEMGVILTLRDPARAEHALNRGVTSSKGLRIRAYTRRGHRYFRLDPQVTTPLLTTVTIADGVLAAGSSVTIVDGMLQRGAIPEARSLGRKKEYRDVVAQAPAGAAAVLYVDTPRVIRYLRGAFGPVVLWAINLSRHNVPGAEPISLADFPSGEELTRHLHPAVTWFETDEEGMTAVSLSDVQNELTTFSFLAGLGFSATLVTREESVSDTPRQVKVRVRTPPPRPIPRDRDLEAKLAEGRCRLCRTNLRLFQHNFIRYRARHGGRVPPDLAAFFGPGPARGPQHISPADTEAHRAIKAGRKPPSSYVYIGPGIPAKVARPERFALIWNREGFHSGKRLVLLLNGEIPLVGEKEFQELLNETRAAIGE